VTPHLAIAAVSATLRKRLHGATGAWVTVRPPDAARTAGDEGRQQLNLFLYHALPNAAWRNLSPPGQGGAFDPGLPPLALNLYYLITAYDDLQNEQAAHALLGQAMSLLHDFPVLDRDEIEDAIAGDADLRDAALARQFEHVRLTWQPLSLEDLSKIWTGSQSHFRMSVAYEASVVLIDSKRESPAGPPVLRRGREDPGRPEREGADVFGGGNPVPTLTDVLFPPDRRAARLGESVVLVGKSLDRPLPQAVLIRPELHPDPIRLPVARERADRFRLDLPAETPQGPNLRAGTYGLVLQFEVQNNDGVSTTRVALPIAPTLARTAATRPMPGGDVTVTVDVTPGVLARRQQVLLLMAGRAMPATLPDPVPDTPLARLTFRPGPVPAGAYPARLRVDGVDSVLVTRDANGRPVYAADQVVNVP
jgi:hypothetical protein